jgi:hypothetical protein
MAGLAHVADRSRMVCRLPKLGVLSDEAAIHTDSRAAPSNKSMNLAKSTLFIRVVAFAGYAQRWTDNSEVPVAMKQTTLLACCIVAAISISCYESDEPLGPISKGKIDTSLVGRWFCAPPGQTPDEKATLEIIPFDETQYYAECKDDTGVSRYRAYSSAIDRRVLLNVQELERSKWLFVRYELVPNARLELSVVDHDALVDHSEKGARREIRHRVTDEKLYTAFASCTRAE